VLPRPADHPTYFGLANFVEPTLSVVDAAKVKPVLNQCQCPFLMQS